MLKLKLLNTGKFLINLNLRLTVNFKIAYPSLNAICPGFRITRL